MQNVSYDGGTTPFNMSLKYMELLMKIRERIVDCRVTKDLESWYRLCQDFYDLSHCMFDEHENKDVEIRLTEIKNNLNVPRTREGQQLASLKVPVIEGKLSDLTRVLSDYLDEHERIFRKAKYDSPDDEHRADYK